VEPEFSAELFSIDALEELLAELSQIEFREFEDAKDSISPDEEADES
jgi:hypothetical protein